MSGFGKGNDVLGALSSGEKVFERSDAHFHKGIDASLIKEALSKILSENRGFVETAVDMKRIVGLKHCVKTNENDQIFYARRTGREGLSRFVKNRKAEPCQFLTVILKKAYEGNEYILVTAFISDESMKEPWDRSANKEESIEYWNTHALVEGCEEIDSCTVTTVCPW